MVWNPRSLAAPPFGIAALKARRITGVARRWFPGGVCDLEVGLVRGIEHVIHAGDRISDHDAGRIPRTGNDLGRFTWLYVRPWLSRQTVLVVLR